MYLAICDDDILLCANLRRKLAAFDTGETNCLWTSIIQGKNC